MTTYSNNLRIPHLDQNVAQPEIPENTAKNIIDQLLSGIYTINATADADITITHTDDPTQATNWQSMIIDITDTTPVLTQQVNVILPDNARVYILRNNTAQVLTYKTTTGAGFDIGSGQNAYGFSDGTNLTRLNFAPVGSGTTLESMTDTPTGYGTSGQLLVTNGSNALTYTNILSGITVKDYGETSQVVTSVGNAFTIDLANGNVVTYTTTQPSTITISTTHTNTSFTMLVTDFGAFTQTWADTILWEGGTEPTWSVSGQDLITFTKIGTTWIAGALIGVA